MRELNKVVAVGALASLIAVPAYRANAQIAPIASSGPIGTAPVFYGGAGPATPQKYISFNSATGQLTVATGTYVDFKFANANAYDTFGGTSIRALLTLTATIDNGPSSSTAIVNGVPVTTITQAFKNITLNYTAVQPYTNASGSYTNLLSVNFTSGVLTGEQAGGSPTFSSSSPATSSGALIGYKSDFLDFSNVTDEQFSIAMSGATGTSGNALSVTGGALDSFNASGVFTFSSNPPPGILTPTPAPPGVVSGLIGIAMGGAQFGMVRFRRRRNAKKAEVAESTEVAA